jgi:RNA polymerase sigma factor (sigma-70 family)
MKYGQYGNTDPLTKEEEIETVRLAQAGDHQAINRIIESNIYLVVNVVNKRYWDRLNTTGSIDMEDLYQEGVLVIFDCLRKYKQNDKCTFRSYLLRAVDNRTINNAMRMTNTVTTPRWLSKCHKAIKLANKQQIDLYKLSDEERLDFFKKNGITGMSARAIEYIRSPDNFRNLDDVYDLKDKKTSKYDDGYKYMYNKVIESMKVLTDKKKEIVIRSLGIGREKQKTEVIAKELGVTKQCIYAMKEKAFEKMRHYIRYETDLKKEFDFLNFL